MKLNPLTASSQAAASSATDRPELDDTGVSNANRAKGEQLATDIRLSSYRRVNDIKELKDFELCDDKKQRARIQKTAAKTIKASGGINENTDFKLTGPFFDKSLKIPQAKLVANMTGEEALDRFFKPGILYKLFGWIPRLFGSSDKAIGTKWLKANSGSMIFDPKNEHSNLDKLANIKEKLKSGRFALSVVYKADDKGNFTKEPEAMVLVDTFNNVISDIEEHSNPVFKARAQNMKAEGLDSFFMPEAILFNPKSELFKSDDETHKRRCYKAVLSSWVETHDDDSNIIIPSALFHDEESQTQQHLYERIHGFSSLYYSSNGKNVGIFGGDATLVRSKNNKYTLPEEDLATMLGMAMISEHSKDYTKLSKKFKKSLEGKLDQVINDNTKAFQELNKRLGL